MNVKHLSILILLLLFSGCDRTESDWKHAKDANTAAAYSEFLAKHPQGTHVDEAKTALEESDWESAKNSNALDAFGRYLIKYPDGQHARDAKASMDDLEWVNAKAQNTSSAYSAYLTKYPSGTHVGEAHEELDWILAKTDNSPDAFAGYLAKYPAGKHLQESHELKDDAEFAAASKKNEVGAVASYLKDNPHGRHVQEATVLWEELDWRKASSLNSSEGWQSFLAAHPDGIHRQQAKQNLVQADYEVAKREGTVPAFKAFLAKWPDSAIANDATKLLNERERLDDFEKDDSAAAVASGAKPLRLFKGPDGSVRMAGEVSFGGGGQDYSNTDITNDTGDKLGLISITNGNKEVATLFITGKEAIFDAHTTLVKGSGYVQAEPGEYFSIVFTGKDAKGGATQIELGVQKIEWDDDGKATKIQGLKPVMGQLLQPDLKIKSDLANPEVKDGVLSLAVDGGREFKFKIRFGQGAKYLEVSQQ